MLNKGVRFGITLFCALVVVAQFIVATGGLLRQYWLMLSGRVLFGVASENLVIAQAALVGKWFRGKELSSAIGYIMTVPELASAANSFLTPIIYSKYEEIAYPLYFSVILCVFSFICALLLVILDKRADKEEQENQFVIQEDEEEEQIERVSFEDIKKLNGTFWVLVIVCTLVLGCYVPFLDDANDLLQEKFEFTHTQAGKVLTLPYLFSAFSSPFIGPLIDKIGKRRMFIAITCLMFAGTQFLFGIMGSGEEGNPNWFSAIPLALLGCSYSMYSCVLIPSIQFVVEQRVMGTAFGLLGMFESIALAFFPIITGYIVEHANEIKQGYSKVGYFFSLISVFGFLLSISLYFIDRKSSMILDFINPEEPNELERIMMKTQKSESDDSTESDEDDEEEEEEFDQNRRATRSMYFQRYQQRTQQYVLRSQSLGR